MCRASSRFQFRKRGIQVLSLDHLQTSLEPGEAIGMDSTNPAFVQIVAFVDQKNYSDAAKEIEEQFSKACYDIRLIAYYLFYAFDEDGPRALLDIGNVLSACLTTNMDAIGPEQRKIKYFNSTIAWLFTEVNDRLSFEKSTGSEVWSRWQSELTAECIKAVVAELSLLSAELAGDSYKSSGDKLSRVLAFLRDFDRDLSVTPARAGLEDESRSEQLDHPEVVESQSPIHLERYSMAPGRIELEISPSFNRLCEKLTAFETVVNSGDFQKAALISDDIMKEIESFDPRDHFPRLFSAFFTALTENVKVISPYWEQRETIEWQMRSQLYRVDLPSFIKSN
jgi:hypothetical protein